MKKTIVSLLALFFVSSVLAQIKVEKLPRFYDNTWDNKIISADMASNGIEPVVLYTTYNKKAIKAKMWDGQEWVEYGKFPEVNNRGTVHLEYYKKSFYALVQTGEGWCIFKRKDEKSDWELYGNANFASVHEFGNPHLIFIEDNPVIFEQDLSTKKVTCYKYQNGTYLKAGIFNELKHVNDDFTMISKKDDHMVFGWTSIENESLHIFEVEKQAGETKQKSITKGLKAREVKEIVKLFYDKGRLKIYYLGDGYALKIAVFNDTKQKWSHIETSQQISDLGFYFAKDGAMITKSRENDLPVFYNYTGNDDWKKGETIGTTKLVQGLPVMLEEALDEHYLLNFTADGDCVVQKIHQ